MSRHLDEVLDVVVLGVPDPEWGESVCAAVTLLDPTGHLTTREVRERLRGILPEAALPAPRPSCSRASRSAAPASPIGPRSGTRCRSGPERWQDGGTPSPTVPPVDGSRSGAARGVAVLRVVLIAIVVFATIYALVDCVQTDRRLVRVMPKPAWLLAILVPVAGPLVVVLRRARRGPGRAGPRHGWPTLRAARPRRRPRLPAPPLTAVSTRSTQRQPSTEGTC